MMSFLGLLWVRVRWIHMLPHIYSSNVHHCLELLYFVLNVLRPSAQVPEVVYLEVLFNLLMVSTNRQAY